ncbi:MAG: hypothetical protein IJ588_07970 [Prevotella sp.]|nr:hypothetical protein [Prevotella sp.]
MDSETKKLNWYYYRKEDGCGDRAICHYLRLEHLISLLETGKLYANRRKEFKDANEGYENKKLAFGFSSVGDSAIPEVKIQDRLIPYSDIIYCPTSCWTTKQQESFLMWKCYATEMGACIKTTVHNLISSLNIDLSSSNEENKVLCGSVDYVEDYMRITIEENQLFDKDIAYADEEEFRFYFHLKSDTDKDSKGIRIPVNTKVMIDSVLLSPFICKEAADKIARMLKCAYNVNVEQSKIKVSL